MKKELSFFCRMFIYYQTFEISGAIKFPSSSYCNSRSSSSSSAIGTPALGFSSNQRKYDS